MKVIDNILYIEFSEAIEAGISRRTILDAKSKRRKSWHIINDPDDKRRVLVEYDFMKKKYKGMVNTWLRTKVGCNHDGDCSCGDPYAYMALQPIRDMIRKDDKAERFYLDYRYNGPTGRGKDSLPMTHVERYTRQASLLNMLLHARKNKREVKKQLGLRMDVFFDQVIDMIGKDDYHLPESYTNLSRTMRKYDKQGYEALIDWRFGNTIAQKVNDEIAKSVLLELIAHPNQYDDVYVEMAYNKWAAENGYKTIDRSTVGVWRRKNEYLIIGSREGQAAYYDKYGKEIKGHRPTEPLSLVESDDNHLDLLFINPDEKGQRKYYHRYKAIVVSDSYNDYILGYAYAETVTNSLIKAAYLNAMNHIHDLTGGWFLPHEIKTDRWGLKELQPLYESLGYYYPTPKGSKRRGYIEQLFGTANWKRSLKYGANNYTGNNTTAKNRGTNIEQLRLARKAYPTVDEAPDIVEAHMERMRHVKGNDGKSKQQAWLEAWCELPEEKKRPVSREQILMKVGVHHLPKNGSRNTVSNGELEPTINGVKYNYSIPPAIYLQSVGKKVEVVYDPHDMSNVLVTDNQHLRFMAKQKQVMPRAMTDFNEGDRSALNAILDEKRDDSEHIADKAAKRKRVLEDHFIDSDTILQAGIMDKELKQEAEVEELRRLLDPFSQM